MFEISHNKLVEGKIQNFSCLFNSIQFSSIQFDYLLRLEINTGGLAHSNMVAMDTPEHESPTVEHAELLPPHTDRMWASALIKFGVQWNKCLC